MVLISQLHGKDVFTHKGQYVGKVADVLINTESGRIIKLALKPLLNDKVAMEVLQVASINYEDVLDIGDAIIVQRGITQTPASQKAKTV